jgi:glucosyl-dolichyl phosphate glucuronosyltransferase
MKPFITIIIPTYNRSEMLEITLDSFISQNYGSANYEIIISNNNSTDNTEEIIEKYVKKYDNVSTIFVEKQGAHYARNAGAIEAKGEILYLTDDDVIADQNLLSSLIDVFDLNKNVAVVTGKISAKFDSKPPAWVDKYLINHLLSLTDKNRKESLIISSDDIGIYMCHQAIRRDVYIAAGGCNPDHAGNIFQGDAETGLNIKIKEIGALFAYTSEAKLEHIIPKSRTTLKYLIHRIGSEGYIQAYTEFRKYRSRKKLLQNIIYRNILEFLIIEAKYMVLIFLGRKNYRFLFPFPFFYLKKTIYEIKLLKNPNFREVVLIDDWIENINKDFLFSND